MTVIPAQERLMPLRETHFIDVHHHVVLPEYEKALVRSGARDPSKPLRKNSTAEAAAAAMRDLGIAGAVVNPLSVAGVHHGDDANARYLCESVGEALAAFAQAAPKTFGFFAPLPYPDIDGAVRQTETALDRLGADGVILLTNQNNVYVGDRVGEPLWAELDRRGAACFIHPARPSFASDLKLDLWSAVVEYPFETTRVAANLIYNEVMRKYPNIRWILAHAGGCLPYLSYRLHLMEEQDDHAPPFKERAPEGAAPHVERFYFDTAISGSRAAMLSLREVAKPANILYGSDWPYVERRLVTQQNATLTEADLFPHERFTMMERDNPRALFPRFA